MDAPNPIVVVPRWGGTPGHDWYPWAREQFGEVIEVLDMPRPEVPTIESWPAAIVAALQGHLDHLDRVLLVGHSVGCQAVLRALATLPPGKAVGRVLCVAGWWDVDEPWETIRPWMELPPDLDRVRQAAGGFHVLLSTNDPFTADYEHNAQQWRSRLGAEITIVDGAKHFNGKQEPVVLDHLRRPC
jgi:predicted alpha/beta hydrolase family esterase